MTLKDIRKELKLSQKDFAKALGEKQSTVGMWETGKSFPRAIKLYKISELTGHSIETILKAIDNSKQI